MTKQRLREALNKADHIALDGDTKYYDFVNLFEAIKPQITNDDQKEMERLVRSKDYEKLNTYMSGIAARDGNKNQNKLTANVMGEEFIDDDDELTLDEIWEEELREGRNDLQPKKCKALLSGNTYYAPYDKKEKMFAQYGSRFRYETEEACWDAIKDPDNDLGYEEGGKSASLVKQHKEEKKKEKESTVESLNEASDEVISPDVKQIKFGEKIIKENSISSETFQMITKPLKNNGELFDQAKALVKLYDFCYNKGYRSVKREDLLKAAGVPDFARAGSHSLWFTEFKILDLAYLNNNEVYPGKNLRDWVEGNITPTGVYVKRDGTQVTIGPGNPRGIDLTPFCSQTFGQRSTQGAQPGRSHTKGGTKIKGSTPSGSTSATTTPTPSSTSSASESEPNYITLTLDMFESVNNVDSTKYIKEEVKKPIPKYIIDRANRIRAAYRKAANLDEDCEITENMIDTFKFEQMCAENGWNFEKARKSLLRKDI